MRVFFKDIQEISPEISEYIYKKKLLPKDDTFWSDPKIPSLTDFQKFLGENKFKSDTEFTQKIFELLDAMMKIEKKHMDISIQASVCYNLL